MPEMKSYWLCHWKSEQGIFMWQFQQNRMVLMKSWPVRDLCWRYVHFFLLGNIWGRHWNSTALKTAAGALWTDVDIETNIYCIGIVTGLSFWCPLNRISAHRIVENLIFLDTDVIWTCLPAVPENQSEPLHPARAGSECRSCAPTIRPGKGHLARRCHRGARRRGRQLLLFIEGW